MSSNTGLSGIQATQDTADFLRVYASATIALGDTTPAGARPITNAFNVSSAIGLDGSATTARVQVAFTTPLSSDRYNILGTLQSVNPVSWNSDNTLIWHVVAQSQTGFVISTREVSSVAQNVNFVFDVVARDKILGTPPLQSISQEVALNTPVILDNIKVAAILPFTGFSIGTVSGTMTVDINATTQYGLNSQLIYGSSKTAHVMTTALTNPFVWTGDADGNGIQIWVRDKIGKKVYRIEMSLSATGSSFIRIERIFG